MITASEACEKVYNMANGTIYIVKITDIGYGYIISTIPRSLVLEDVCSPLVYKANGKVGIFFPPHHNPNEVKNGLRIEVPEKYRCPDELYEKYLVDNEFK